MTEIAYSRLQIAGKTLEVARYGAFAHPRTIVLLHEALGSVSHWRDFPIQLAHSTKCNVMLYSRAGHGESEGPVEQRGFAYIQRQAAVVLKTLLDHLHIQQPVLFGHSEGAVITLFFAAAYPSVPRALILESPVVQVEAATVDGMRRAEEAYRTSDLRAKLQRHHRDPDAVFQAFADPWMQEGVSADGFEEHLRRITCPTLILQGDRDEYSTTKQGEILSQHLPNSQAVVFPDCGHTPHREQSGTVLERVTAFLAGIA